MTYRRTVETRKLVPGGWMLQIEHHRAEQLEPIDVRGRVPRAHRHALGELLEDLRDARHRAPCEARRGRTRADSLSRRSRRKSRRAPPAPTAAAGARPARPGTESRKARSPEVSLASTSTSASGTPANPFSARHSRTSSIRTSSSMRGRNSVSNVSNAESASFLRSNTLMAPATMTPRRRYSTCVSRSWYIERKWRASERAK